MSDLSHVSTDDEGEFCDGVYSRLVDSLERRGAEPSSKVERLIILTWDAAGIIGNGGFEYLFESQFFDRDQGYRETLQAFRTLQAEECYRSLAEAIATFPGGQPPSEAVERVNLFSRVPETDRWRLKRLFWRGKPTFYRALAAYIKAHHEEIEATLRIGESENR